LGKGKKIKSLLKCDGFLKGEGVVNASGGYGKEHTERMN
jgi:hypothetical protein